MLKNNRFFIAAIGISLVLHLYIINIDTGFNPENGTYIEIPVTLIPESEVHERARPATVQENQISMPQPVKTVPGSGIRTKGYRDILIKKYLSFIRDEIQERKFAPPDSKYYGLIGNVLVGFTVYADGTFHNIIVLRSSGDSLLDATAIKAVKSCSGKIKRPAWTGNQELRVSMTIKYQYSL